MLQMKWTLTRWSKTIFWLAWMMDWPMLWRPRILRTFKGWWTRLLCWRTADVWWSASVSWCVSISRAVAPDHVSSHHQLDLCSILLNHSFNLGHSQLDKDSLLSSVKWFSALTISRLLLLGIRMFRGLKLLWTQCSLNESAMLVARRVILPTNAPTYALIPRQLHLHDIYPWSQLCSYCYQAELCTWESQPYCCGGSPRISRRCYWYVFRQWHFCSCPFNSRALHSFISATYVRKHNQPLALLKCQIILSSPGGDMPARQLC
jgi:hypothetical protein